MAEEDILFGKNRHLFGGIEPSNMLKFEVIAKDGLVTIDARLPEDTVVDGQTLCTVAGAVIRRKTYGYPKDEFDGEKVADIKDSMLLTDVMANDTGTYYYAAFPYTSQGVYNRNPFNRASLNASEPAVKFTAKNVYDYTNDKSAIVFDVKLPEGSESASITRSTYGYPIDPDDGETVMTIESDGTYTDENVTIGVIYYYSIFPRKTTGGYSYESKKVCVKCARNNYLFGFDLDMNDPDPETRVTYPSDVDNYGYEPARMDYGLSRFDYGDWSLNPGEKFMPKPCMLNYDGTVDHYLDPNDYSKRDDGVTDSRVSDAYFKGNAMMEWPKIYTKREEVNGVYKFRCSDQKLGEDWDCWCNYDIYDNQIPYFYTSIYSATLPNADATDGTRFRSLSGTTIHSTDEMYSTTRTRSLYRVNGTAKYESWDMFMLADHLLIEDLLILMGKSTDCQTVYGLGVGETSNNAVKQSGTMDAKGLFWGNCDHWKDGVKVFGMEHYWGNCNKFLLGWSVYNGKQYAKITRGAHDGKGSSSDTAQTKYNKLAPASYSSQIPITTSSFSTNYGYSGGMKVTAYGRFPIDCSGSSTTYEADYINWSNTTNSCSVTFGGICSNQKYENGPFALTVMSTTTNNQFVTVTLSCKPVAISE